MTSRMERSTGLGLFLVSAAILALEVLHMRILSVQMWYHHAYIIVTMAMLAFAIAGTVTTLMPSLVRGEVGGRLAWCSTLFGITALAGQLLLTATVESPSLGDGARLAMACGILLVPYFFGGMVVTIALSTAAVVHRRYFVNLLGSALGAWLFIAAITPFGGERLLVLIAAIGPIAALAFARCAPRRGVATGAAAVALLLAAGAYWQPEVLRISVGAAKKKFTTGEIIDQRWTPLSRLDVLEDPGNPKIKHILQDGMAGTIMYAAEHWNPRSLLDAHSVAYVPHLLRQHKPTVLVIGIGGGSDLRAAVDYGAASVLGLEINEEMTKITGEDFAEFNGDVYHQPGVSVVVGEGRSTLRMLDAKFDIIQLAGADTYTAGASGSFVLSESYLYTTEALTDYFDHLTPQGKLGILRFYDEPPRETLRIFGMALLELRRRGIEKPSRHAAVIRNGWTGGTVFSLEPLDDQSIALYAKAGEEGELPEGTVREFSLLYLPDHEAESHPAYVELAHAIDAGTEDEFYAAWPVDIRPCTDDSPFFYNVHHITEWVDEEDSQFAKQFDFPFPVAPSILRTLLLQITVLVAGLVLAPLFLLRRGGLRARHAGRHLALFMAVGAGFMFLEISMIQRLILFLGHPTYSLTVVLFCFLFFAGLGSLWSGRYTANPTRGIRRSVIALCVVGFVYAAFLLGPLLEALLHWPLPARIGAAIVLLAPLNFLMGMPFPLGLTRLKAQEPQLVPWAIGANGGAGVIGSILAVIIAMETGFTVVAYVALATYLVGMLIATSGELRQAN